MRLTTRRGYAVYTKASYPSFMKKIFVKSCGGTLETCKDDTPEAIRVRIDTFLFQNSSVIEHYKELANSL